MSDNLKDILSHLSTDIDQETLLLYLQDKLSEEKKHEVEKQLLENEFADDAIEGLKEMRDKQQIAYTVEMLNRDLRKKTEKKKLRREKMKLPSQTWLYISIFIILLLIILSYFVIHRMQHPTG
jgi:asparagine synthetase B (glutamine-hydrolysing)